VLFKRAGLDNVVAEPQIRLIVGLGNPGAEYARTRHNAGFWFVDELAALAKAKWKRETRFQSAMARADIAGQEVWLLKPQTMMNGSGAAVGAAARFYQLTPDALLIVHDEIDLPAGVARLKHDGGHGGHNGLRDVIANIGAQFWRLRLGVGHPGNKDEVIDYVLKRAGPGEQELIDTALQRSLQLVPELLRFGAQKVMNQLHRRDEPDLPA